MADNSSLGTSEQLRDPNYTPPLGSAVPLGIQHVLAMFVSNVTPAIIIAFAAGFGFGSPDAGTLVYLIQMSMFFAGVATLIQTIGMGPIGAKLPIVQGTSFAYLPVMIPAMAGAGVAGLGGLMTGVIVGGIFHFFIGMFIKRIRFALPPLVTGLIVLMIGLALVKVGIQYAAGGVPAIGKPEFGSLANWFVALVVIFVTLGVKFFTRGLMSIAAVLIGLVVGYIVAFFMHQSGMASFAFGDWFGNVGRASWFQLPNPFRWGFEWNWAIIIGMCLMAFISAIETVGDVSGITKGGAGREATDEEIQGATFADGLGTAISGIFGGLPNTSFSQNVGLISMTGVMSRHVVTIGAVFLIICGLIPKIGAVISTVPIEVLGGGVIVMFGMVASAGVNMLSDVNWGRRNMIIFATALSIGLGLQLVPEALQHVGGTWKILLTSGLLPAAFIAIVLNLFLPDDEEVESSETALSGLSASDHSHGGAGAMAGSGSAKVSSMADSAAAHAGQPTSAAAMVGGSAALSAGGVAAAYSDTSSTSKGGSSAAKSTAASAGGSSGATAQASSAKSSANKASTANSSGAKSSGTKVSGAKIAAVKSAAAKGSVAKSTAAKSVAKKGASTAKTAKAAKSKAAAKSTAKPAAKVATKSASKSATASTAKSAASKSGATKSAASKTAAVKKPVAAKKAAAKPKVTAKAVAKPAAKAASKPAAKSSSKASTVKSGAKKTATKAKSSTAKLTGSALDDLEFVDGIGPKTSKSLQGAGVKNLSGLIAMTDDKLEAAAQKAGTGGRPKGEKWKKQAKDILSGKPPQAKSDRAAWEKAKKKV